MAMRSHPVLEIVEILDLRHYSGADLRPLLEKEAEYWAREMAWDYHSSVEMILRYVDSKILPGYVALENGRIAGYSFFVYEGSKGVIGDLYADPQSQGEQIRTQLLTHSIETLQQTPGIQRVEAQLLAHPTGAVAVPFLNEGFRGFRRLFMELPIASDAPPTFPGGSDIEIRRWAEADFQNAAHVITQSYTGHIDSDINDQYRSVSGSLRFLNNIVRFPGCGIFDAHSSLVAVRRSTGMMVGLLLCSRVRDDVGHVTQVCLLPEYRSRGLGQALIASCAAELARRHFSLLTLTVTEANRNAVELYKRMGFVTRRVFDAFVWEG
jgi:ribosomal protein S18 acetylase RimI-like enzyme